MTSGVWPMRTIGLWYRPAARWPWTQARNPLRPARTKATAPAPAAVVSARSTSTTPTATQQHDGAGDERAGHQRAGDLRHASHADVRSVQTEPGHDDRRQEHGEGARSPRRSGRVRSGTTDAARAHAERAGDEVDDHEPPLEGCRRVGFGRGRHRHHIGDRVG